MYWPSLIEIYNRLREDEFNYLESRLTRAAKDNQSIVIKISYVLQATLLKNHNFVATLQKCLKAVYQTLSIEKWKEESTQHISHFEPTPSKLETVCQIVMFWWYTRNVSGIHCGLDIYEKSNYWTLPAILFMAIHGFCWDHFIAFNKMANKEPDF